MNRRDQLLKKARTTKNPHYKSLYKKSRNHCNSLVDKAKRDYNKNQLEENSNNPEKLWKTIKSVLPFSKKTLQTDHIDANVFCKFFSSVASKLKSSTNILKNFVWQPFATPTIRTCQEFKFQHVSKVFIEKHLKNLKKKKSTGLDEIPPGFLRYNASIIAGPLSHVINLSLNSG